MKFLKPIQDGTDEEVLQNVRSMVRSLFNGNLPISYVNNQFYVSSQDEVHRIVVDGNYSKILSREPLVPSTAEYLNLASNSIYKGNPL